MFSRKQEVRKAEFDELVIDALMPVFPPTEMRLCGMVKALAFCVVMETPGWSDITIGEIRASMGRIYTQNVVETGKMNQSVTWNQRDVWRYLYPYKVKYPDLPGQGCPKLGGIVVDAL